MEEQDFEKKFEKLKDRLDKVTSQHTETADSIIIESTYGKKSIKCEINKRTVDMMNIMHGKSKETLLNEIEKQHKAEIASNLLKLDGNDSVDFMVWVHKKLLSE